MKKTLLFVAVATLFFASCQKELSPAEQNNNTPCFRASIEQLVDPETKATINGSNQLVWATGDKIGIYFHGWGEKSQAFTLSDGNGTTEGTFTRDQSGDYNPTDASIAVFPYDGFGGSNNNIDGAGEVWYYKLKDWYDGYTTSGKMLTPLVASISSSADVSFKHAGAAVKLTINNLVSGGYKAKMTAYNKQITGYFHVTAANAGTDALVLNGAEDVSQNYLTLNTYKSSGAFSWIFPVPVIDKPKLKFEITDGNGVLVWKKSLAAQSNDLGRGDILVMPAKDINAYEGLTEDATWTFCGNINGSKWLNDVPMMTDGNYSILSGCTFAVDDEFKIRKDKKWTDEGGDEYPAKGESNWKITSEYAGTKDIIFNKSTHEIRVVAHSYPYPAVDLSSFLSSAITIDGNMSDWTGYSSLESSRTDRIRSWKFTSDEDNVYFYFVLRKNRMNNTQSIKIIFDWDSSGSYKVDGGAYLDGGEALIDFQPFTNSNNDAGTKPTCVNGTVATATINGSSTDTITAYGYNPDTSKNGDSDDYYLEVSIPKASIPSLPASGAIRIGAGCYYDYTTGYRSVTL